MRAKIENGKIVVTRLNPMSKAPQDSTVILAYSLDLDALIDVEKDGDDSYYSDSCHDLFKSSDLGGWIPYPEYQPEPADKDFIYHDK